jgi:hypothetical protein
MNLRRIVHLLAKAFHKVGRDEPDHRLAKD